MAFPPNTDTPGFEEENKGKPEITKIMEDEAGLYTAPAVASEMVKAVEGGRLWCYFGVDGWMLHNVSVGMGAVDCWKDLLTQVFLGGLLRAIGVGYARSWRGIAEKEATAQNKDK